MPTSVSNTEYQREYYRTNRERISVRRAAWREANKDKVTETWRAGNAMVQRRFAERRSRLAAEQNNTCPCGEPLGDDLNLDHDHACCDKCPRESCGACDRSVMHNACNQLIGLAHESPDRLRKLADYLDSVKGAS